MDSKSQKCGGDRFVQVGIVALREPGTGAFLPEVPLFVRAEDCADDPIGPMLEDFAKLMAGKIKEYKDGCRKASIQGA